MQIQPLPADNSLHNDTLLFFENANITFEGAQVLDIFAGSIRDILQFASCPSVVFENFSTTGCQAFQQLVEVVNSTVQFYKSSFRNALSNRGLTIVDSSAAIYDTVFDSLVCPEPSQSGGALYVDNSDDNNYLYIQASNFTNNMANSGRTGGAVRLKSAATCQFEDVRFVENTSGGHGGAVLIDQSNSNISFRNCLFANNTAEFSGVVYAYPNVMALLSFVGCTFIGNAGYQGGALSFWQVDTVWVDSCRFENNSVHPEPGKPFDPGSGAALYATGYDDRTTSLYISNSVFLHNFGVDSAGAAAVVAGKCKCVGVIG